MYYRVSIPAKSHVRRECTPCMCLMHNMVYVESLKLSSKPENIYCMLIQFLRTVNNVRGNIKMLVGCLYSPYIQYITF